MHVLTSVYLMCLFFSTIQQHVFEARLGFVERLRTVPGV